MEMIFDKKWGEIRRLKGVSYFHGVPECKSPNSLARFFIEEITLVLLFYLFVDGFVDTRAAGFTAAATYQQAGKGKKQKGQEVNTGSFHVL